MAGVGGFNAWRWIFIIEGFLTIVVAVISKIFIVDWPHQAKFLTAEEKEMVQNRLHADIGEAKMNYWNSQAAKRTWGDWKVYVGYVLQFAFLPTLSSANSSHISNLSIGRTLMYFGVVNTGYSISFFAPTILQQLGWLAVRAQVMSIPIYIAAAIVALITALLTDYLKHRYTFVMVGVLVATIGYILLLAQSTLSVAVRYFAVYLVICGGYITQPVVLAWVANNMAGHYKRSFSSAFQIGFGNLGGIVASNIYLSNQAPTYPVGYGASLGLLWICAIAATGFALGLWRENRLRNEGKRNWRFQLPAEEVENLGDDYPGFRFTY